MTPWTTTAAFSTLRQGRYTAEVQQVNARTIVRLFKGNEVLPFKTRTIQRDRKGAKARKYAEGRILALMKREQKRRIK